MKGYIGPHPLVPVKAGQVEYQGRDIGAVKVDFKRSWFSAGHQVPQVEAKSNIACHSGWHLKVH